MRFGLTLPPDHMIAGSDRSSLEFDAGLTWDYVNTLALGQFYEIGFDMQKPYHICGSLQDNGNWCGPSATLFTRESPTKTGTVGGNDGMYMQIDPTDHNTIYVGWEEGNLARATTDRRIRSIRPRPGQRAPYRFSGTRRCCSLRMTRRRPHDQGRPQKDTDSGPVARQEHAFASMAWRHTDSVSAML
jgi:hypothetical protein